MIEENRCDLLCKYFSVKDAVFHEIGFNCRILIRKLIKYKTPKGNFKVTVNSN